MKKLKEESLEWVRRPKVHSAEIAESDMKAMTERLLMVSSSL